MNYYDILEISQNASPEVIQNAYKTLAKKYHPDVYQGDKAEAEERMKLLNEAYEVLSDPQKRMEYDSKIKDNSVGSSTNTSSGNTGEKPFSDTSAEHQSNQSDRKQKHKKPFWALSWIFITLLMFFSIMFSWKWLFAVSLLLGCGRFIANKKEPAYKTRGFVRIISICIVGFMIISCFSVLFFTDSVMSDSENNDVINANIADEIPETYSKANISDKYSPSNDDIIETQTKSEEVTAGNPLDKDISQEADQLLNKIRKKYNIVHGTSFSDGIAFIKYYEEDDYITAYENHSFIYAAIDTSGNELFRLDNFLETENLPVVQGGIYIRNNSVYNNKGKLVASPQMTGYDEIYEGANHNGYVIVTKYTESYKGAYYSIGVLDNEGKWEVPLCEEGQWGSDECLYTWANRNTYYGVDYYLLKEDIMTNIVGNNGQDIVSVNENGDITVLLKNHEGLLCILQDTAGNESKVFGNEFLIAAEYIYDSDIYDWVTGPYNVLDFEGNILLDLSEYNIVSTYGCDYYNGYFLFVVENNNGSEYLCLVDKNGELVAEPIKVYYPKVYKTYYPLNEKGYVFYNADDDSYNHIGYDGNVIKYSDVDDFYGFSDGLALVYNSQTYRYYYINYKGEIIIE